MVKLRDVFSWAGAGCVMFLLAACATGDAPGAPTSLGPSQSGATVGDHMRAVPLTGAMQVNGAIPSWILNPETLPPGRRGKNNCTFAFGQEVPQWDFHPDAGCWERPGPDGWTRNQQYKIHVPQLPNCGGGPGDVSPIRVCQVPGMANPCPINPTTGPSGCAICVRSFTCH